MANETQYEPLGSYPKEAKVGAEKKVYFRFIGGVWAPEFTGDTITHRDMNLILRSLQVGFRRYTQMANSKRRQFDAEAKAKAKAEVKNAVS